jgi:heptosyltransferase-2
MPDSLIVRLPNWLGDTVMAVPLLRALREARPGARVLLAGPWAALLAGQGLADVAVTYPRSWRGRIAVADRVRAFGADTAVLLPNSLEAALAARYWLARRVIGFATGGRSWLLSDAVAVPAPRPHQVDEYAALLGPLAIEVAEREPRLSPPGADAEERRAVRALLGEAGVAPEGRPLVGIHLGAAYGAAKVWPRERVAELARLLPGAGAVPVLVGAPDDAAAAEAVRAAAPVASLVGRDRPELLTALLAELDVLVAGDTGVAHLAAALGTPVVALFGPTDPALTAPRGRAAVLRHPVPCAPCFYRECPIEHPCLASIGVAAVAEGALALARAAASP